jgi:hypothetical protein
VLSGQDLHRKIKVGLMLGLRVAGGVLGQIRLIPREGGLPTFSSVGGAQ